MVSLADRIHPIAGTIVFWSVCLAAGFFALYYAVAYTRLPPALGPPEDDFGPKYDAYLQTLRARLATNPRTRDLPVVTKDEIEKAIGHLSTQADLVVRRTASTVFLSTALMQNGRLDGLVVLFTQIQMVGRIARIYVQRPSPREPGCMPTLPARLLSHAGWNRLTLEKWSRRLPSLWCRRSKAESRV